MNPSPEPPSLFPKFTEANVNAYRSATTHAQRSRFRYLFAIDREHLHYHTAEDQQKPRISLSLYAAPADPGTDRVEVHSLDDLRQPHPGIRRGKETWYDSFWPARHVWAEEKRFKVRVYLENQLHFLWDELVHLGFEVVQMQANSILASPGQMWRFLALESSAAAHPVLCLDFDMLGAQDGVNGDWGTEFLDFVMREPELFYRIQCADCPDTDKTSIIYRPFRAGSFGLRTNCIPRISEAMQAWCWWSDNRYLHRYMTHPDKGEMPLFGMDHPFKYGGDEQFLTQWLYHLPEVTHHGIFTRSLSPKERGASALFLRDLVHLEERTGKSAVVSYAP